MSNLAPQKINLSYSGLLQVPGGLTSSLQYITDGNGVSSGLQISTTGFSGPIVSDTVTITGGTINGTAIGATNPSFGRFSSLTVSTLTGLLKGSSGAVSTATANTDYLTPPSGTAILKANSGGALANATSGVDYAPATSGTSILKANGSGGFTNAVSGVDYAPATSGTSIVYGNGSGGFSNVTVGSGLQFVGGTLASVSGGGSVTTVSVVSANGFTGTVANASSTPAITLATSVTGLLKGNGTAISAASAGTDYAPATSGTSILYGDGAGGFSNVTVGSGLSFAGGTLSNSSAMTYPGAGMAVSTGSAWGTSKTTPTGDVVGTSDTQTLTNKTLTAAGSNTVEATSGPTSSQLAGQRNKIINGAMMIDQRNAGASVTPTSTAYVTVDRWIAVADASSKFSIQQMSDAPTGFSNSVKLTSLSSYTVGATEVFGIWQNIEGFNTSDLNFGTANSKTVTVSFWVKSSLTGTFGGSLSNADYSRFYPFSYTISAANTWEQKSVTIAGDATGTWIGATNGIGLRVFFGIGAGSSRSGTASVWASSLYFLPTGATSVVGTNGATFYITGVQLEKGATATPFENRLYGTELALCQRYYYKAITGTLFNQLAFCNIRTTTSHYAFLQLPVTMRANPSSVDYSVLGVIASWGAGPTGLTSLSLANAAYGASTTQVLLDAVTTGAVGTVGQISMLIGNNNASGYVALNAEL